ncbi:MAG: hypothetical protein ACREPV_05590 [Lysobacter sp.]
MRLTLLLPLMFAVAAMPVSAADPKPEIDRPDATAQAVGAAHTLRSIPEACARIEGMFTGQAVDPYKFAVVRTSPNCQPRARFVDAAKARPSVATGWIFNDLIRVPNASCPSQQAVVKVWRKPGAAGGPELDAQGRARIYLGDSKQAAEADKLAAIPVFAASMAVESEACE